MLQYMELLDKRLAGAGSKISAHPGVTLSLFSVTFFRKEKHEAACFTGDH